jgi:hypothetical protein
LGWGFDEIPAVAVEVLENGDRAVRLGPRGCDEWNSSRAESVMVTVEVVGVQEERHPPADLISTSRKPSTST